MAVYVYLVVTPGMVLAVYGLESHAELHARCVTGATVVAQPIRTAVAPEVLDDLQLEEWLDEDTPVVDMSEGMLGSPDGRNGDEIATRKGSKGTPGSDR